MEKHKTTITHIKKVQFCVNQMYQTAEVHSGCKVQNIKCTMVSDSSTNQLLTTDPTHAQCLHKEFENVITNQVCCSCHSYQSR